jgi:Ras-related GTP-binding protein C/D
LITDIANSSFIQFQIWDFPGQIDPFSSDVDASVIFKGCKALIFVIDSQDDLSEALTKLQQTAVNAYKV